MCETWVQSLGWEDPLEKGRATNSGILDWRIPWKEEPGTLQSMRSQRVRHNWRTNDTHWEKKGGWSRTWESDLHETVLLSQDLEYESWSCHQCQTSLFCKRSLLISRDFERIYWLNTTFLNSKVLYKSTRTHSYDFLKYHLSNLRNYHQ